MTLNAVPASRASRRAAVLREVSAAVMAAVEIEEINVASSQAAARSCCS